MLRSRLVLLLLALASQSWLVRAGEPVIIAPPLRLFDEDARWAQRMPPADDPLKKESANAPAPVEPAPGESFAEPECGDDACLATRFYSSLEYLYWRTAGMNSIPLAITAPPSTPRANVVLGNPATTILFGGERLLDDARSGGRFTLGYGADERSLEANYLLLERAHDNFHQSSLGNPILARPFFDTDTQAQASDLVAFPNVLEGTLDIRSSSELQTGEIFLRNAICRTCSLAVDGLLGYRYLRLADDLRITEDSRSVEFPAVVPIGTLIHVFDQFATSNTCHALDLGLDLCWQADRWSLHAAAKAAVGVNQMRADIRGGTNFDFSQSTNPALPPLNFDSGVFALPSNIGAYQRTQFVCLPEVGAALNYQVTDWFSIGAGYSLLYASRVARASEQLNPRIDRRQIPPPRPGAGNDPTFHFVTSDYWAQGLTVQAVWVW